jgi:hypothetical protein
MAGVESGNRSHDLYQALTDVSIGDCPDTSSRKAIGKLLIRLVDRFQCLPPTLFLSGVRWVSKDAVDAGGYADIFRGTYQGKEVALKRLRVFRADNERIVMNRVSVTTRKSPADCIQAYSSSISAHVSGDRSMAVARSSAYLAISRG